MKNDIRLCFASANITFDTPVNLDIGLFKHQLSQLMRKRYLSHRRNSGGSQSRQSLDCSLTQYTKLYKMFVFGAIYFSFLSYFLHWIATSKYRHIHDGMTKFNFWHFLYPCLPFVCCLFGFNVAFNNLSVTSRRCLVATWASVLLFIVLRHGILCPGHLTWHCTQSHYPDTWSTVLAPAHKSECQARSNYM